MATYSGWVEEYQIIKATCTGDFITYVTKLSENCEISNRLAVLMLGIFCEKNARVYVNRWLKNLHMDQLTRRNQADALFLYTYAAVEDTPIAKRQEQFIACLREYLAWKEEHGLTLGNFSDGKKVTNRNKLYPEIITFGDLHARVANASHETQTGTMKTIRTDQEAMVRLDQIIAEKKSVSAFLDYLMYEDDSIHDYNRKATLYVQKMLYSILKYSLDLLCEHNLPTEEERKKQYIEAKDFVLSKERGSAGAFDRFVNYNRLFLKNINKEFRKWLQEHQKTLTVSLCIEYLKDNEIYYNRLFTNLYYFLVGKKYDNIVKEMTVYGRSSGYEKTELSEDVYVNIFGDSIQCRKRIMSFLQNVISGNTYVKRSFLTVFGMYAGYDKEKINKALCECGFDELSSTNELDKAILEIVANEIPKSMRDTVNSVNFLNRVTEEADDRSAEEKYYSETKQKGEIEREDYKLDVFDLSQTFKDYAVYADDEALQDIFSGDFTKNTITDFSGDEIKNLRDIRGDGCE